MSETKNLPDSPDQKASQPDSNSDKKVMNHSWTGTWTRPVKIDEKSFDPLTVARMTDHNVRGGDIDNKPEETKTKKAS